LNGANTTNLKLKTKDVHVQANLLMECKKEEKNFFHYDTESGFAFCLSKNRDKRAEKYTEKLSARRSISISPDKITSKKTGLLDKQNSEKQATDKIEYTISQVKFFTKFEIEQELSTSMPLKMSKTKSLSEMSKTTKERKIDLLRTSTINQLDARRKQTLKDPEIEIFKIDFDTSAFKLTRIDATIDDENNFYVLFSNDDFCKI